MKSSNGKWATESIKLCVTISLEKALIRADVRGLLLFIIAAPVGIKYPTVVAVQQQQQ